MKEVPLTQGRIALVSDEDFSGINKFKWHAIKHRKTWYAMRSYGNGSISMHREILSAPIGTQVDHRDGNGLNNQRTNIRFATGSQNQSNRGVKSNNTSGYKGVGWDKVNKKWVAQICINYKIIKIGRFNTKIEAAKARDAVAIKELGEFAWLNFPEQLDQS